MIRLIEEKEMYLYDACMLIDPDIFNWLYGLAKKNHCHVDDILKCLVEQCYEEGKEVKNG